MLYLAALCARSLRIQGTLHLHHTTTISLHWREAVSSNSQIYQNETKHKVSAKVGLRILLEHTFSQTNALVCAQLWPVYSSPFLKKSFEFSEETSLCKTGFNWGQVYWPEANCVVSVCFWRLSHACILHVVWNILLDTISLWALISLPQLFALKDCIFWNVFLSCNILTFSAYSYTMLSYN